MLTGTKTSLDTTQAFGVMLIATMAMALFTADYRGANARPIPAGQQGVSGAYAAHNLANGTHGAASLGLIQSGIVGVSQMDATGQFGSPTAMPIYQVIRIQAPRQLAANHNPQPYAHRQTTPNHIPAKPQLAPTTSEATTPPGITIAPPTKAANVPTQCQINDVALLTASPEACTKAGGNTVSHAQ